MKEFYDDYVNKIEGHGILYINFKKEKTRFEISGGERLFEGLVLEKSAEKIPFIVSRICGICPTVHYLTAIKALEKILDIEPSPSTILLRKLMLSAQIIQSHNLHLFFLVLPDYLKLKKDEAFPEKYPTEFHIALNIKRIADRVLTVVGGRSIHPINPVLGGFSKQITHGQLSDLKFELENTIDEAEYTIELFSKIKYPELKNPTTYLALSSKNEYEIYDGFITSNKKKSFQPSQYQAKLKEKIIPNSSAKVAYLNGKAVMTGALARLNLAVGKLNTKAAAKFKNSKINLKNFNSFNNIPAQAIEILHFIEESIKIIDQLQKTKIDIEPGPYKLRAGKGAGAAEAPRGTLYHYYETNSKGQIIKADILVPTGQSLSNLEKDTQALLKISKGQSQKEKEKIIEQLIRAYDPCLTCSVH